MATTLKNDTAHCPHCGFESHDNELCRACGKLIDDKASSSRHVQLSGIFKGFFSWLTSKGLQGIDHQEVFKKDPMIDPEFSALSGNIFNEEEK